MPDEEEDEGSDRRGAKNGVRQWEGHDHVLAAIEFRRAKRLRVERCLLASRHDPLVLVQRKCISTHIYLHCKM